MTQQLQKDLKKQLFKQTFKNVFLNYNFIIFHFVIFFIPFFATIISSLKGPNGALYVISVGLATSFITIFNQFLFLLSAALVFVCMNKNTFYANNKDIDSIDRNSINSIIFVASLFSIGLFILTAYLYITYSVSYENIDTSGSYGFNYVLLVAPSLLFNGFIYLNLIYLNEKKKIAVTLILIEFLGLNLILIPLFYLCIDFQGHLSTASIGLAISVSSFIILIVMHFIANNHYDLKFKWSQTWLIIKKTSTFIINFLLATFMKSILIVAISLSLALSSKNTPINLMLAKVIWYNSLYFCEFFADGLLYSIEYANMKNFAKNNNQFSGKAWLAMSGLSSLVVLITCVIFNFSCEPLAKLYVSNQTAPIVPPSPEFAQFWPYGPSVNATEVFSYLWAPNGVYNFNLPIAANPPFEKVPAYALMYTTIYHVLISATKVMGISEIAINQKLNLKAIISKFIIIAIVMVFIAVFSIVPAHDKWFNEIWPGIDGFSFSLMLIGILLTILTFLSAKKNMIKRELPFEEQKKQELEAKNKKHSLFKRHKKNSVEA